MRDFRSFGRGSLRVSSVLLTLCGAAASAQSSAPAAQPGDARAIHWRSDVARIAEERATLAAETPIERLAALAARPERHVLVQLDRAVNDVQRAALDTAGVRLLRSVGENAFFAVLPRDGVDAAALAALPGVALVRAELIGAERKLHPLWSEDAPSYAIVGVDPQGGALVAAYVVFHPDVTLDDGRALAEALGALVRDDVSAVNALVIELPLAAVAALAAEDGVQWIEPPLPRMSEWNDSARTRVGAAVANAAPYSLNGSGVTVLVYDAGFARATHVDFGGRLTVRDASGLSGHSTHVAGTIGGNGAASGGLRAGMAPGVTLQSYGFQYDGTGIFLYSNPGDIQADYNQAINTHGADIANNSIGTNTETNGFPCNIQGDYGVTDQLLDNIVRGSLGSPFRVIWANGNERQGSRCDVEGFGDYYSTAPPATAKNHITVGALNSNNDTMTSFSSWGPTDDGRMKPDISSAGCQSDADGGLTSCWSGSDTQYAVACGTSMASPTVCGASALLMQDYRAHFPGPDMRNSMLKIFLAHTAVDLGNVGPDYQFGYGSVRIVQAIDFMRLGDFRDASVSQDGVATYVVAVPPGTPQLKVTMAWDDFPGTPNVVPSLVNDLDLRVRDPSSTQAFPWTLNPGTPTAAAVRTARNSRDNVEQVLVDNPVAGTWTIEVHGFSVPQGPQSFSLCASPDLADGGPCTTPAAPTSVAASDATSCTAVTVTWSAAAGATAYEIWRNTVDDSGTAASVGTDAASPFDDTTAAPGTPYFYWVTATNACGASGFSASDAGSRDANATPAPLGVAASDATSCTTITVSWSAVAGATGYEIWRNTVNDSGTATQIGTDGASPFADTTAGLGTHFYFVRAVGTCGTSPFSASDAGSRNSSTTAAPTGVAATDGTSCTTVTVAWNAVAGATTYEIWRSTVNSSGTAALLGTDGASPFTDATAAASTTYFYWVRSVGPCDTSPFSASDSGFRGTGTAPGAPSRVKATDGDCAVTVTWRAASGATGYEIWRGTTTSSASAVLIGTSPTLSFVDSTGTAGQIYQYWVKATNGCGTSGFSNRDRGHRISCP